MVSTFNNKRIYWLHFLIIILWYGSRNFDGVWFANFASSSFLSVLLYCLELVGDKRSRVVVVPPVLGVPVLPATGVEDGTPEPSRLSVPVRVQNFGVVDLEKPLVPLDVSVVSRP